MTPLGVRRVKAAARRDPLADLLSLAEASELCGLAAHTLTQQAKRGQLHARLLGRTWVTTRAALADYLAEHSRIPGAASGERKRDRWS